MNDVPQVTAEPLTAAGFAPFGRMISVGLGAGASANQGTATRYDHCADLRSTRPGAQPNLVIFRSVPKSLPFDVVLLERHPCSTQVFLPLVISRYLVVVAPTAADGGPELSQLRAFLCGPGQGIEYAVGTWHHPMVVLDTPGDLAMFAWEDGTPLDCEVRQLGRTLRVVG